MLEIGNILFRISNSFLTQMKPSPRDANLWIFLNKEWSEDWPCEKGSEGESYAWTVSWVNLMNMLSVPGFCGSNMQILRENWELYGEPRGLLTCSRPRLAIQIKQFQREASIPTVRPSQVRSDNQPSVPHPRVHSPIRWADWLSRLRPWGGQTRLTGCHGDLMDWSEQISSPKTPERIAGFQRIALASARWVSFRSSFLRSFLLPSFRPPAYRTGDWCSLKKR